MTRSTNSSEFKRPDMIYHSRKWHVVRDLIQGDQALKDHDYGQQSDTKNLGAPANQFRESNKSQPSYLRQINPKDMSDANTIRNAQYIKCAVLVNATKHTQKGMSGLVFRKRPVIDLPSDIDYAKDDIDGSGLQVWQQMKSVTNNVVGVGRHGLLVDFPSTKGTTTVEDVGNGKRAFVKEYTAEQIINWRSKKVGSREILTLVVLLEDEETEEDDFITTVKRVRRVLRLVKGKYVMEVKTSTDDGEITQTFNPKDGLGKSLDFIPFQFVGSENNSSGVDDSPLYDIAVVNIGHYRNSADVEENSFFASQLTVTATGMTQAWVKDIWKGEAQVGSRAILTGPVGCQFGSIQADESNLARKLMEDKEKQMVQLGAKLIQSSQVQKTATQSNIDSADSSSTLSTIAGNVNDAYQNVFKWIQLFMNSTGEFTVEVSTKFGIEELNAQDMSSLVTAMQSGGLSLDSFLWNMKIGQRIPEDRTIKEERDAIEEDNLGTGMGGDEDDLDDDLDNEDPENDPENEDK